MDKEISKKLEKLFDECGNCATLGDPSREENATTKIIFDDEGYVNCHVINWLEEFIKNTKTVKPLSDAVKIIHADEFAGNTKGNYSAIFMWR